MHLNPFFFTPESLSWNVSPLSSNRNTYMLHWFELNCPGFMQPAVSWKVIKEANTIFWLQCVGTWDTCFSRPSTPFLLISNNLKHNGRRIVIKESHISVRKRDSFRLATEIIAVWITMTTLSMTCISEFPAGITEPALFLKKLCSWTCPLSSSIWGSFQSVCTVFENVTSVCPPELIQ